MTATGTKVLPKTPDKIKVPQAYMDLREFLAVLEAEGQLVRIKDEVDPEEDCAGDVDA